MYCQILSLLLSCCLGAFGTLIEPFPQNQVVFIGATNVVMNCATTKPPIVMTYEFEPAGGFRKLLIFPDNMHEHIDYAFEQPNGTQQNNLIIRRANALMAGIYSCSEHPERVSAHLIIISSGPSCTSNVSASTKLYQGQSVQMSCSISYFANYSLVFARMVWSTGNSLVDNNPTPTYITRGNETTATTTINQVVGYSSPFPIYQCNTTFTVSARPSTATNTPDYFNVSMPFSTPVEVIFTIPTSTTSDPGRIQPTGGVTITTTTTSDPGRIQTKRGVTITTTTTSDPGRIQTKGGVTITTTTSDPGRIQPTGGVTIATSTTSDPGRIQPKGGAKEKSTSGSGSNMWMLVSRCRPPKVHVIAALFIALHLLDARFLSGQTIILYGYQLFI